jgi:hypothetical protein
MFTAGLIAALGFIFLLLKFNVRRVARFDIMLDVLLTALLMWIFAGTFAGMMAGLTAGLIISMFLFVIRRTVDTERLAFVKTNKFPYRKFAWVRE